MGLYGESRDVVDQLLVSMPCNMPSAAAYDSLADCEAAVTSCTSEDPDVKFFDENLLDQTLQITRQRSSALVSSSVGVGVAVEERLGRDDQGAVSFKRNFKDVAACSRGLQLEVNHKEVTVDMILNCCNNIKDHVWVNNELKELVGGYFDTSLSALNLCGVLQDCLQRTRERQDYIRVALEHMSAAPESDHDDPSCMTEVMTDCEDVVLKELDAFAEAPDPFLDDFTEEFEKVYESHVAMQKRLELKKKKINDKLSAIQGWIKIFNNTFILCGLVADQNLHLEELENTTTKHIEYLTTARLGGSYCCCCKPLSPSSSFCSRFYLRIKATKAIVEAAFRGNYLAIQDLNNIKVSVDRLESEIAAIVRNIRFGDERHEHDPFSLQVAMVAIGWKQAAFIKLLTELQESTVTSSHNRICKARRLVLQRIVENQEYVFKRKPDFLRKEDKV